MALRTMLLTASSTGPGAPTAMTGPLFLDLRADPPHPAIGPLRGAACRATAARSMTVGSSPPAADGLRRFATIRETRKL